ncbi:MAG: hypothetical protein V2A56_02575 [bacterium]
MRRSNMRTVILTVVFFSVCVLPCSLFAGTPGSSSSTEGQVRYILLHYNNTSGELGVSTFDGKSDTPSVSLWELLDGSRYSINYLHYDNDGNMILKERFFSEGRVSKNIYQYDEMNRLVAEQFERSDGVTGNSTYSYENGLLVRADHRGHNGWFRGILEFRYNDLGQKSVATIFSDSDSIGAISYTYDDLGNQVGEIWNFDQGWQQTFEREYAPVPKTLVSFTSANPFIRNLTGVRVAEEDYDFSGKLGGPSYYEYDGDSNRLVRKRFVRSDSLETVTTYIYHPDGRLLRSYRSYADGRTGFFRYEYNPEGFLVRKQYFMNTRETGSETYSYDDHGRLVTAEYVNMDSWLTGKLIFKHDRKGRLKQGQFAGSNGLTAVITFKMDKRNNPVKIVWKFVNGMSQIYKFTYETASD